MSGGGCRPDSVDLLRMCATVNTPFSAVALDSVAQFLQRITLSFKRSRLKMRDDPEGDFSVELHLAESVECRLQQLEASVN